MGYFQRQSWFCEKPWLDSSSRSLGFQSSEQTWLPVSTELSSAPVDAFHVLMQRSAVPAPLVRRAVWLVCGGARVGYACSWWSAGDLARLLPDAAQPIGAALARAHVELRRELLAVTRTAAHAELDEAFGVARGGGGGGGGGGGDALWARWYLMYERGRAFALVHEVFSPRLQREGLGPSEVGSG